MSHVAIAFAVLCATSLAAQPQTDDIVRLARTGWDAARGAAKSTGSAESLAPAARALAELDKTIETSRWPLQGIYGRSLVAAAIAAAQDERAEMDLHLTHARELSVRLETSAYPAEWPMRIDEAAGELWLEVDEYAEALTAFQRAVAKRPQASSWLGLARSAVRLKETARACEAYREATGFPLPAHELQEARDYLSRCP